MSNNQTIYERIDKKLDKMTHEVGVTLTNEEVQFLKQSLKSLDAPKMMLPLISNKDTLFINNRTVFRHEGNPGFCYAALVRCLPSFEEAEPKHFEDSVEVFINALGPEPKGKDVILWLCLLEYVLNGSSDSSIMTQNNENSLPFLDTDSHLKTLAKLTTSMYRFQYHDDCGRLHVVGGPESKCGCTEILCDHGWASRFILQIITRDDQVVGSDIDFSELFGGEMSKPDPSELSTNARKLSNDKVLNSIKEQQNHAQVPRARPDADDTHQIRMREQLSNDMIHMLEQQLNARTESLQLTVETLMRERNSKNERQTDVISSDCIESETDDDETVGTLCPKDSSSVLSRYGSGKKYMSSGSVITKSSSKPTHVYTMKRANSVLEPVQEVEDLTRNFDVVQGFVKTQSMREKERESLTKVYAINGLAAPFKDKDLNFLIHFHTALETCGMNPMDRPIDAFEYLAGLRPKNPTEELMKQVITRTFDFDDMTVISNPFQLPFINVGMNITESGLCKCMSLMKSKYRNSWFDQMKCLRVPSFHNEFDNYSSDVVHRDTMSQGRSSYQRRRSRRDTSGSGSESATSSSKSSAQKKKSTSILGLRM